MSISPALLIVLAGLDAGPAAAPDLDAGAPEVLATDAGALAPDVVDAGPPVAAAVPDAGPPAAVAAPKVEPKPELAPQPQPEEAASHWSLPAWLSPQELLLPPPLPLTKPYYEFNPVYASRSFGFPEGRMALTGLHVNERNGALGKMLVYIFSQLALAAGEAAATSTGKHLGTEYGPGYRIDYYRNYTSQELADMRAAREAAGDDVLSSSFSLDFTYYLPVGGFGKAQGYSLEVTPLTIAFDDEQEFGMEIAFSWSSFGDHLGPVSSTTGGSGPGVQLDRRYNNLGVPIRFMYSGRFVQATLQWVPNILSGFGFSGDAPDKKYQEFLGNGPAVVYATSPLSLSVSVSPIRHLFVRATGTWERFQFRSDLLSYQLEAGLRF